MSSLAAARQERDNGPQIYRVSNLNCQRKRTQRAACWGSREVVRVCYEQEELLLSRPPWAKVIAKMWPSFIQQ